MVSALQMGESVGRNSRPMDFAEHQDALLSQLTQAGEMRSSYEIQLFNLQAALQTERKNKGEHQLKLYELQQAIEEMKQNEADLLNQIDHWRRKAQAAMEPKTHDQSERYDPKNQYLQDMDRLQKGEAYWRQQASNLTQQYEQAEDDVRKLIREVQVRTELVREKEVTERVLRQEINQLNQKLRGPNSSPSSQHHDSVSMYSKQNGHADLHDVDVIGEELSGFARVIQMQTILLHQGNYEEAEVRYARRP